MQVEMLLTKIAIIEFLCKKPIGFIILIILSTSLICSTTRCIHSRLGNRCKEDVDCQKFNELHLYCNKTFDINVCAFDAMTYIGHTKQNFDCPGEEFSAVKWSSPIPEGLIKYGVDCMRMCLNINTCFGIVVKDYRCYLKNDLCFENLQESQGASLGVLNVIREDYKCGCKYNFTRTKKNGKIDTWIPTCPQAHHNRNPYRCCSDQGLCILCPDT